jgi:hypothetical protein
LRDFQALLAPQPLHALTIDLPAFLPEQRRDAAITVAWMLPGQFEHLLYQSSLFFVVGSLVTLRRARLIERLASATLGDAELLLRVRSRPPLARRA